MSEALATISRPQRWDVPFESEMGAEAVARILSVAPFSQIDASRFPASTSLPDILLNDTGLRSFKKNQVIVREGDYGNSAFFIITGSVRVALGKDAIPAELLGRRQPEKKNFLSILRQLWGNARYPEVRSLRRYKDAKAGAEHEKVDTTAIFLHDVPSVLKGGTAVLTAGMFFGEIAALSRTPRTATIFAEEDC